MCILCICYVLCENVGEREEGGEKNKNKRCNLRIYGFWVKNCVVIEVVRRRRKKENAGRWERVSGSGSVPCGELVGGRGGTWS